MGFLGAKSLDSFLKKRKWTGEQAGKAIIADRIYTYKHKLAGEKAELFTQEQVAKMVATLPTEKDIDTYNDYVALSRWLDTAGLLNGAHYLLYDTNLRKLISIFSEAENAQRLFSYIDKLPLILTEKDYNERKEKTIDKELHSENSYYSIFDIIQHIIEYYRDLLEEQPRKANPLKAIKKLYEKETITTPYILNNYNAYNKIGYYTTQDGRRVEDLTDEEYRRTVCPPSLRQILDSPYPNEDILEGESSPLEKYAIERINAEYEGRGIEGVIPPVFHIEEQPPAKLSKWEIFTGDIDHYYTVDFITQWVREYYNSEDAVIEWFKSFDFSGVLDSVDYDEANPLASLQTTLYRAMYAEFKEAIDILLADADSKYSFGLAKYTLNQWGELMPCQKLYECNFYGYADKIKSDLYVFDEARAIFNGIAILRPFDMVDKLGRMHNTMDASGHYVEPFYSEMPLFIAGLEQYTDSNPNREQALEDLDNTLTALGNELYYIQGYDMAIRMIAKKLEMPELTVFCPNIKQELGRIEALQVSYRMLYKEIKDADTPLDKYKQQKLDILDSRLCTIDLGDLTIPADRIKQAQEFVDSSIGYTASKELILALLCTRGELED